jgi:regulation of enolase protein 1 (concanavalin A-like superfamily)
MSRTDKGPVGQTDTARRAEAAAAARKLVEGLSRDITDRAPVAIVLRSRPLWARLTRRSDPFRVTQAQVEQWLAGIEARHPPLTVTSQTASDSGHTARLGKSRVA